jgi:hypothetical protein
MLQAGFEVETYVEFLNLEFVLCVHPQVWCNIENHFVRSCSKAGQYATMDRKPLALKGCLGSAHGRICCKVYFRSQEYLLRDGRSVYILYQSLHVDNRRR